MNGREVKAFTTMCIDSLGQNSMLLFVQKISTPTENMAVSLASLNKAPNFNAWMFSQYKDWIRWGNIWEIGSGTGNMSEFLTSAKFLCLSEYDDEFRTELSSRFVGRPKVSVEKVDLNRLDVKHFASYEFDTIISTNVLEHIEDDIAALRAIGQTMKPETVLITLVPAHKFLFGPLDKIVGHYRRYSKKLLREHLEAAGQEVLEMKYFNRVSAIAWFLKFKVFRRQNISENDMGVVEKILPLLKLEEYLPLPFGQSVIALSRIKNQ